MTAVFGPDGKPMKIPERIDRICERDERESVNQVVDSLRGIGLSDEEIAVEIANRQEPQRIRRIPEVSSYPAPQAPLSQQTMDRLHEPGHPSDTSGKSEWLYKGECVRHRQFLQTDNTGIIDMQKHDLTVALLGGKGGGFSAATDLAYIFFDHMLAQKSRVDIGGIPERIATIGQYQALDHTMREESPDRPRENRGIIQRMLGGERGR